MHKPKHYSLSYFKHIFISYTAILFTFRCIYSWYFLVISQPRFIHLSTILFPDTQKPYAQAYINSKNASTITIYFGYSLIIHSIKNHSFSFYLHMFLFVLCIIFPQTPFLKKSQTFYFFNFF